jgi:hypothetical protein
MGKNLIETSDDLLEILKEGEPKDQCGEGPEAHEDPRH